MFMSLNYHFPNTTAFSKYVDLKVQEDFSIQNAKNLAQVFKRSILFFLQVFVKCFLFLRLIFMFSFRPEKIKLLLSIFP